MFTVNYTYWKNEETGHGWKRVEHSYTYVTECDPAAYVREVENHARNTHGMVALDVLTVYRDAVCIWSKDYTNLADCRKPVPTSFMFMPVHSC